MNTLIKDTMSVSSPTLFFLFLLGSALEVAEVHNWGNKEH